MTSFDNRRWMYKKFESDSVVSQDWVNNVVQFVQICGSNPLVENNEKGMMRCPCVKCKNQKFESNNTILEHFSVKDLLQIMKNGSVMGKNMVNTFYLSNVE